MYIFYVLITTSAFDCDTLFFLFRFVLIIFPFNDFILDIK